MLLSRFLAVVSHKSKAAIVSAHHCAHWVELLGQSLTLRSTHMREIRKAQRSTLRVSENPLR